MKRKIYMISIVCFCMIMLYAFFIIVYGHICKSSKSDVCVVLGNKVNKDGTVSERLQARLDKALEIYRNGYSSKVIVSGGLGKEGFEEVEVMRLYLLGKGVEEHNIIVDKNGINTLMTAKFTADYLTNNGYESVIVVSQYFHLFRTQMTLKKLGIKKVKIASPSFYEIRDLFSIPREMVAVLKYLFV